jgi:hypothetical protein
LFPLEHLACTDWATNGELVATLHELGYIGLGDRVLDVTYGRGKWWDVFRPADLTVHDLHTVDGVDFRDLPEPDEFADVTVIDAPFVPQGGTDHEHTAEFRDRYGLNGAPQHRTELTHLIMDGIAEAVRVTRRGGLVLVKCQPFQSGKFFHNMPAIICRHAEGLGLRQIDQGIMRRRTGPTSTLVFNHLRSNYSVMLVFQRRTRRRQLEPQWSSDRGPLRTSSPIDMLPQLYNGGHGFALLEPLGGYQGPQLWRCCGCHGIVPRWALDEGYVKTLLGRWCRALLPALEPARVGAERPKPGGVRP